MAASFGERLLAEVREETLDEVCYRLPYTYIANLTDHYTVSA